MKTRIFPRRNQGGYALLMVLMLATLAIIILGATMKRTATTAQLNERQNQYNATFYAAEAAVEKTVGRMLADYIQGQDALISNNVAYYRTNYPTSGDNSYWANFQFSDGLGHVNKTYVSNIVDGANNFVPLQGQYYGLSGWRTIYRTLSNAKRINGNYSITNAVQQDMEMDSIPIFQFAIFYNSALEFTWATPFTINGRVHANGPIYTGVSSSSSLTFNSLVTTTATVSKKALGGYLVSNMTGGETNTAGYTTNVPTMALPIGTNNASAATIREIVNIPPSGEDVNSPLGLMRYYNKAGLVILVSNATVFAAVKSSANDASPTILTSSINASALATNFPFLSLTNTFSDQRESKTVKATQIDMFKFKNWAATNAAIVSKRPTGNPLTILYVADKRTVSSTQLEAIRLVNGTNLPSFGSGSGLGFTVATPDPLYVLGNYNASGSALGTTNTSATVPASLISDSLTILSSHWNDATSLSTTYSSSSSGFDAADTTINAAIMTGVVYSTGTTSSTFSGGVHNLTRLLEDWSSRTLTLNTSIINLYDSVHATNQFRLPGSYYNAPTRQFSFDVNFLTPAKQPPGTPILGVFKRYQWATPPPDKINYAGP